MPFDLQSLKKELQPSALKERAQNINDRYSSPSTASTGYGSSRPRPPTKPKAPLPPSKPSTLAASKPPPPLPQGRGALPPGLPRRDNSFNDGSSAISNSTAGRSSIDWSHLSTHDKNEFFNLLDGVSLRSALFRQRRVISYEPAAKDCPLFDIPVVLLFSPRRCIRFASRSTSRCRGSTFGSEDGCHACRRE